MLLNFVVNLKYFKVDIRIILQKIVTFKLTYVQLARAPRAANTKVLGSFPRFVARVTRMTTPARC